MKYINKTSRCAALYRQENLEQEGISGYQDIYILLVCRHPGISQEQLARRICVNKSSVTRQVSDLEQKGYVVRQPDGHDRRVLQVFPTEKAQAVLPKVRKLYRDWNEYLLKEFSPEEKEQLGDMLKRVMERALAATGREQGEGI